MKTIILLTCLALNAGAQTVPTNKNPWAQMELTNSLETLTLTNGLVTPRLELKKLPDDWPKDLKLVVDFQWELATNWLPATASAMMLAIPGYKPTFIETGTISSNLVMVVKDGSQTHQIVLRSESLWMTNRAFREKLVREYE